MKRNRIIGAVLALGILSGAGFGFKAMADSNSDTNTTTNTQTQTQTQTQNPFGRGGMMNGKFGMRGGNFSGNFEGNFGGFMRGMRGFWSGNQGTNLTTDQQKEINTLRAQIQNIKVDYQAKMVETQTKLTDAIKSGVKADILSAWDASKALKLEIQTAVQPTKGQITTILGTDQDQQKVMTDRFENSPLNQQMENLKNATTDEDSQKIINELQTGRGQGFRGPGMMNNKNGNGFNGGCQGRGFRR